MISLKPRGQEQQNELRRFCTACDRDAWLPGRWRPTALNVTPVSWGQTAPRPASQVPDDFSPGVISATPAVTTLR